MAVYFQRLVALRRHFVIRFVVSVRAAPLRFTSRGPNDTPAMDSFVSLHTRNMGNHAPIFKSKANWRCPRLNRPTMADYPLRLRLMQYTNATETSLCLMINAMAIELAYNCCVFVLVQEPASSRLQFQPRHCVAARVVDQIRVSSVFQKQPNSACRLGQH